LGELAVPIYEYECDQNKHRFEKWQSVQDEPIKTCPVCGGPVHKLFHPAGIIFKGSGWYITDSRKPPGASESSESSKSETKSEKPASNGSSGKKE
jgi:putative FmdB family regulatory protein